MNARVNPAIWFALRILSDGASGNAEPETLPTALFRLAPRGGRTQASPAEAKKDLGVDKPPKNPPVF